MTRGSVDRGSRDHYRDADLYDHEYRRRREDVRWYRETALRLLGGPGRILELGCGSGRVTLPLLRDGHEVVALDRSRPMLARLRKRLRPSDRCRVVEGDLRDFDVGGRFPLIVAAFNTVEHLYTRVELAACLRRVAAHLTPGGRFVFDVQVPDLHWLVRDPHRRWSRTRFRHPRTGEPLVYTTNHDYDPIGQIAQIRIFYDRPDGTPVRVVHLSQRKFFPAELEALIFSSGFAMEERFFLDNGDSQVLICRRSRRK